MLIDAMMGEGIQGDVVSSMTKGFLSHRISTQEGTTLLA